ncbi:MAG TPA: carboxypeptidase regulatory-like domain-containing protein, partial [Pyrinomonadaceae bacterium]|nr:carboxypeptidase regulatory-like domain-containing protein [Pyrinomonadaceae bacterium]
MLFSPSSVAPSRAGLSSSAERRGKETRSREYLSARLAVIFNIITFVSLTTAFSVVVAQNAAPANLKITVRDQQAGPIAGATCSVFRPTDLQKPIATATTDESGATVIAAQILPGQYVLRVKADGFDEVTTRIAVSADNAATIEILMKVATVSANVTVSVPADEATTVQTGSATPAANLKRATLQRLPLATGRVDEALPLIPGVIRSAIGEINIAGATEQQSALLVNGLNSADPASGNFRLNLPLDSIESVQVFEHPYASEYGASTGGVTEVRTR